MAPLDEYIERDGWDLENYPQSYLDAGVRAEDGARFGIPFRGHPFMLFYRQDVFEELELDVPTTWAELEAASEAIKEGSDLDPISMYYGINAGQNMFIWEALVWSNGGDLFDENWEPTFNDELAVEATQRYIDFLNNEMTGPGSVAFNEQEGNAEYNQGRAWMLNAEQEKEVVLDDSDPALNTNVAVRLSVLDDDEVNEAHDGLQRVGAKVLEDARSQPLLPEWPEIVTILEVAINEMAASGADVQETLDQAAEDVRDVMVRNGYYE